MNNKLPPYARLIFEQEEPARLDHFLAEAFPEFSRSHITSRLETYLVNNQNTKKSVLLQPGDVVEVTFLHKEPLVIRPASPQILFEDPYLYVFNKRAGEVVHPAPGNSGGTISDFIKEHLSGEEPFEDPGRPGIVHRLDKETTGVLLAAKTAEVERNLKDQFKNRTVNKKYIALVHGVIYNGNIRVDSPIARSQSDFRKREVNPEGKEALTEITVLKRYSKYTLLEVTILTGRTHQIRVHMEHLGYPICGDAIYGKKDSFPQMMLCARKLEFTHPVSNEKLSFEIELPESFHQVE